MLYLFAVPQLDRCYAFYQLVQLAAVQLLPPCDLFFRQFGNGNYPVHSIQQDINMLRIQCDFQILRSNEHVFGHMRQTYYRFHPYQPRGSLDRMGGSHQRFQLNCGCGISLKCQQTLCQHLALLRHFGAEQIQHGKTAVVPVVSHD